MNFNRNTAERPGYRYNGVRKTQLINQANLILMDIGSKGISILQLMKHLGIKGDSKTLTTKQWSGVIGALKAFKRENGL